MRDVYNGRSHPGSSAVRIALGCLGALLLVGGLALAIAVIADLLGGQPGDNVGGSIGAFVLFAALAVGGFVLVRASFFTRAGQNELEARVLALAEAMGGHLTVDVTAAHCGLGVVESKAILDRLVLESGAQLEVSLDGVLVYSFPGFIKPA